MIVVCEKVLCVHKCYATHNLKRCKTNNTKAGLKRGENIFPLSLFIELFLFLPLFLPIFLSLRKTYKGTREGGRGKESDVKRVKNETRKESRRESFGTVFHPEFSLFCPIKSVRLPFLAFTQNEMQYLNHSICQVCSSFLSFLRLNRSLIHSEGNRLSWREKGRERDRERERRKNSDENK